MPTASPHPNTAYTHYRFNTVISFIYMYQHCHVFNASSIIDVNGFIGWYNYKTIQCLQRCLDYLKYKFIILYWLDFSKNYQRDVTPSPLTSFKIWSQYLIGKCLNYWENGNKMVIFSEFPHFLSPWHHNFHLTTLVYSL